MLDAMSENMTTDYKSLAQELMTEAPITDYSAYAMSERLCVAGALEFLMPWQLRAQLVKMKAAGCSDKEIAIYCRVPERYVNVILSSAYGKFSTQVHMEQDKIEGCDWGGIPASA